MRQFEDVPTVQLFSCRDMEENLNQLRSVIEDMNKDWAKRVEAVSARFIQLFWSKIFVFTAEKSQVSNIGGSNGLRGAAQGAHSSSRTRFSSVGQRFEVRIKMPDKVTRVVTMKFFAGHR
jgi:hypothetical protein